MALPVDLLTHNEDEIDADFLTDSKDVDKDLPKIDKQFKKADKDKSIIQQNTLLDNVIKNELPIFVESHEKLVEVDAASPALPAANPALPALERACTPEKSPIPDQNRSFSRDDETRLHNCRVSWLYVDCCNSLFFLRNVEIVHGTCFLWVPVTVETSVRLLLEVPHLVLEVLRVGLESDFGCPPLCSILPFDEAEAKEAAQDHDWDTYGKSHQNGVD